ncbi:MAG TPA: PilZ domain-containing protein [Bryobacteraceae bacterium]|nr:PilZ domain-containing protein [Bryobacteraceae bacterium]
MDLFRRILDTPFPALGWEQQLLVVTAILSCVAAAICAAVLVARSTRRLRLHERRPVGRPVWISWRDGVGLRESDDGFCQDLSNSGAALDLPFPLKVRTKLNVRMSEARLSGAGVVRRCTRVGPRYVVGVKFDSLKRGLADP